MNDQLDTTPVSGGVSPVLVYSSDAVITMPPDATLQAVADELARDEIGLVSARDGAYTVAPT